ncbi:UNVERIFIED_CONTAM: hypothetical protein FKN15_077779 [Acipenser sinensis]
MPTPASLPFFACEFGAVLPYKRGFFCNDPSISYPYLESESISDGVLIAGGIAITVISAFHISCMFKTKTPAMSDPSDSLDSPVSSNLHSKC